MDTRQSNNKTLEREFFKRILNDDSPELDCTRLDKDFNLDGDTLVRLANSISHKPIHTLILNHNSITTLTGLKAILNECPMLKDVWLNYCDMTDDLLIELANDPKLQDKLKDINLQLDHNLKITDKGLAAAREHFSPLTTLSILMNNIEDSEISEICRVEAINKIDSNENVKRAKVAITRSKIEFKPESLFPKSSESSSFSSPRMFSKKPAPKSKRKKVAKTTKKRAKISKNR